jgi:hypothetical protein
MTAGGPGPVTEQPDWPSASEPGLTWDLRMSRRDRNRCTLWRGLDTDSDTDTETETDQPRVQYSSQKPPFMSYTAVWFFARFHLE